MAEEIVRYKIKEGTTAALDAIKRTGLLVYDTVKAHLIYYAGSTPTLKNVVMTDSSNNVINTIGSMTLDSQLILTDGALISGDVSMATGDVVVADSGKVGLGSGKVNLVFNDETTDDITVENGNLQVSTGAIGINATSGLRGNLDVRRQSGEPAANVYVGNVDDSTSKTQRLVFSQYNAATNPAGFVAVRGNSPDASTNTVSIGGGSSTFNSATTVDIYAGATSTTATGTKTVSVTPKLLNVVPEDGVIMIGGGSATTSARIKTAAKAIIFEIWNGSAWTEAGRFTVA